VRKELKWDLQAELTISRGRKVYFRLTRWFPFSWINRRHRDKINSCLRKIRYKSEAHAVNCAWEKKKGRVGAYQCECCEGWHLYTVKPTKPQ